MLRGEKEVGKYMFEMDNVYVPYWFKIFFNSIVYVIVRAHFPYFYIFTFE